MTDERRRSARVAILGQLKGRATSLEAPVSVREVSLGGMALESEFPFPADGIYDFALELGDGSTLELRARVVHSHPLPAPPGAYLTGFEFLEREV